MIKSVECFSYTYYLFCNALTVCRCSIMLNLKRKYLQVIPTVILIGTEKLQY